MIGAVRHHCADIVLVFRKNDNPPAALRLIEIVAGIPHGLKDDQEDDQRRAA